MFSIIWTGSLHRNMSHQLYFEVQNPEWRYLPASKERRKTISLVYVIVMNYRRLCGVKIRSYRIS